MREIKYIPFEYGDHILKVKFLKAFEQFLERKQYILGEETSKFESSWAKYCQTNYCIGVGNGYDALFLSLKALNLNKSAEVIVPAHTFAATTLAVLNAGLTPVLIDADDKTFNIDATRIEEKITENTNALIAVHLYGNPCEMNRIIHMCKKYDLFLIEDNAQAQGAKYKGQSTGSFGHISATSFYPIKNLGAFGDAGAINTNDEQIYKKLKLLRSYGSPDKHAFEYQGVNSRLDDLQSTFLNIKLEYLDEWNLMRSEIAHWYFEDLSELEEVQLCQQPEEILSANHIFPILVKERDPLRAFLLSKGIQTLRHYPQPYYLEQAFSKLGYKSGDFPVTEKICSNEISLPIFPGLRKEDVKYICQTISDFYR